MQKKSLKIIIILLLLIMFAFITKGYVQAIYGFVVNATIPPHYTVKAEGDNLYIQTNMKVYLNNTFAPYQ